MRPRPRRIRPVRRGDAYGQLWRLVDGALADTLAQHPEWVVQGYEQRLRRSAAKRITGQILAWARERARAESSPAGEGRSGPGPAADTRPGAGNPRGPAEGTLPSDAGAAESAVAPAQGGIADADNFAPKSGHAAPAWRWPRWLAGWRALR